MGVRPSHASRPITPLLGPSVEPKPTAQSKHSSTIAIQEARIDCPNPRSSYGFLHLAMWMSGSECRRRKTRESKYDKPTFYRGTGKQKQWKQSGVPNEALALSSSSGCGVSKRPGGWAGLWNYETHARDVGLGRGLRHMIVREMAAKEASISILYEMIAESKEGFVLRKREWLFFHICVMRAANHFRIQQQLTFCFCRVICCVQSSAGVNVSCFLLIIIPLSSSTIHTLPRIQLCASFLSFTTY